MYVRVCVRFLHPLSSLTQASLMDWDQFEQSTGIVKVNSQCCLRERPWSLQAFWTLENILDSRKALAALARAGTLTAS